MWTDDPDDYEPELPPSKSQLKRDSAALHDLGQELIELAPEQLARLDLPPGLLDAVRLGRTITAHGGLRRQRKYIGKLLRDLDPEPIRQALADLKVVSADAVRLQHTCERWRERMLAGGDAAVNEFLAEYPEADRQKLRQLVRDGQRERERQAGQAPRAARALFRHVRETLSADVDGTGDFEEAPEAD